MIRRLLEWVWFLTGGLLIFLTAFTLVEIGSFLRDTKNKFGGFKRQP